VAQALLLTFQERVRLTLVVAAVETTKQDQEV
jgi:hypothetical protein